MALACTIVFLELNGIALEGDQDELIAFIYTNLENRTFRKEVLEAWLHGHTRSL